MHTYYSSDCRKIANAKLTDKQTLKTYTYNIYLDDISGNINFLVKFIK